MITPSFGLTATERVLPRLALDFTTASLDSRITFTRALNTATRINSSGLVELVNADVPRFDYDPITLVCKGLLIEESRENFCFYSEDMANASWTGSRGGTGSIPVLTSNAGVAPDGSNTADQLVFNRGAGTTASDLSQWASNSISYTISVSITVSVWVKTTDNSTKVMRLITPSGGVAAITVTGSWQRFTTTHVPLASGSASARLRLRGGSELGPETASVLVWGWQVETGAFATSYIPTTSTSLVRNADVATMTGTNFSDWYNASEGTFFCEYQNPTTYTRQNNPIVRIDDGTNNNFINLATRNIASAPTSTSIRLSGGTVFQTTTGGVVTGTTNPIKMVGSYNASNITHSANGVVPETLAHGGVPTVNILRFNATNVGVQSNAAIIVKKMFYYPFALTVAEQQAFSK